MVSEPDDATDDGLGSSPEGGEANDLLPQDERDTLRRGELVFPTEADTLTMHASGTLVADEQDGSTATLRRGSDPRDTTPISPSMARITPPMNAAAKGAVSAVEPPDAPAGSLSPPSRPGAARTPVPPPPSGGTPRTPVPPPLPRAVPPPLPRRSASLAPPVDERDILASDDLDDATEASTRTAYAEDPTSPTLSLANRSDSSREVYRLFLASEYAPALDLANELIAQGDDDPMLITIARECRMSLATGRVGSSTPPSLIRDDLPVALAGVHGGMTLDQVAARMGVSLDQVVRVLERFASIGAVGQRLPTR